MGIQAKQKSKRERISQVPRLAVNTPDQATVTPALLPESGERSQQFGSDMSTAEIGVADSALATRSDDQTASVRMVKIGDETHVTIISEKSIMRDFGTKDPDFFHGLVHQVGNASPKSSRYLEEIGLDSWGVKQFADEVGVKSMLAFIKECKPRDPIEATLLAQMAATNAAAMSFANRLANAKNLVERDSAERTFNKLMRTFAVQVEALQRYRSKNENKVIFQHVSVSEGGQAIVGNVTRRAHKRASKKRAHATPLIADARQTPMEDIGEQPTVRVPLRRKQ